jgi:hypothetical protein
MPTLADARNKIKVNLTIYSNEFNSEIDLAIRFAIRLMQGQKWWFLRKNRIVALTTNAVSVATPSDFSILESVDLINAGRRTDNRRGFRLLEYGFFKENYLMESPIRQGTPVACSLRNTTLFVSHRPLTAMSIDFDYYQRDAVLPTADTATSVWLGEEGFELICATAQFYYQKETRGQDVDNSTVTTLRKELQNRHESQALQGAYR